MGKHRDEIWQELNDHDARLSVLEDRGHEAAELRAENARLIAERDALRARIEAGDVVDERKGERRKGGWKYCGCPKDLSTFCPGSTDFCWRPINESPRRAARDNRRDAANTNDRRRTPGTRADRKAGSNEA